MTGATGDIAPRIGAHSVGARCVTSLASLRPGWRLWLKGLFWSAPRFAPFLVEPLLKVGTVWVGRWSIVRRWPDRDRPGAWVRARPPILLFETDWDGRWRPYIEDLARVMPVQWIGIWGGAHRFPGPLPTARLLRYIEDIEHPPGHYYSAHADTSLREAERALALESRLAAFLAGTAAIEDDAVFAARWRAFLNAAQELL